MYNLDKCVQFGQMCTIWTAGYNLDKCIKFGRVCTIWIIGLIWIIRTIMYIGLIWIIRTIMYNRANIDNRTNMNKR